MDVLTYYSRKDVQKAILLSSKDREVAVKYGQKGFGKRPDILQYESDVLELAKQGATSFHISEERWQNPLHLKTGLTKKQLDDLRIGWDLVLDIDGKSLEYSKKAGYLIVEALKFHDIKKFSVKFSGNKGFHIGVPFESFPPVINNSKTETIFPEGPKIVASFLQEFIKDELANKLLEGKTIKELEKESRIEDLTEHGVFDPFKVVDIDTILISSRHMFRAPYSLNEKSGLSSIPIKHDEVLNFNPVNAKIENVQVNDYYLRDYTESESSQILIQALDWNEKSAKEEIKIQTKKYENFEITEKISDKNFPPCIKKIAEGLEDGRKRALFILINFLSSIGYNPNDIERYINEWNKKNTEPLRENYIVAQLNWHKRSKEKVLPANCSNPNYYVGLEVCQPDNLCRKIKNPVSYAIRKNRFGPKKRATRKRTKG